MKTKIVLLLICVFVIFAPPAVSGSGQAAAPARAEAWATLQKGVRLWDPGILASARDRFLAVLLTEKSPDAGLLHGLAVCDYRLANFYLVSGNAAETERYVAEARKYGEQARDLDPAMGESFALEAYLIGMVIALHPDQAMGLIAPSGEAYNAAFSKSPDNPRVFLLKGLSVYYTPEQFGGGPANAQSYLEKATDLFEKESGRTSSAAAWGREEAWTYLAICHKARGNAAKAREYLKKALEIAPDYALASRELKALPEK